MELSDSLRVASEVHNKKERRQQSQATAREILPGYRAEFYKWFNTGKDHPAKLHDPCLGKFRTPAEQGPEQLDLALKLATLRAGGLDETWRSLPNSVILPFFDKTSRFPHLGECEIVLSLLSQLPC